MKRKNFPLDSPQIMKDDKLILSTNDVELSKG